MKPLAIAFAALLAATPLFGAEITVEDAYARAASPLAKSGAAFMRIVNAGDAEDRLLEVASEAAEKTALHTHEDAGDGVLRMRPIEGGLPLPAGATHVLERGGDHVMLMGLTGPLEQGDTVTLTLTFEQAGEIAVEVPVDNERQPAQSHGQH